MIRKQLNQLDPFDELITLQSCQEIYINIAFDSVMFGSYLYHVAGIQLQQWTACVVAAVDCMYVGVYFVNRSTGTQSLTHRVFP